MGWRSAVPAAANADAGALRSKALRFRIDHLIQARQPAHRQTDHRLHASRHARLSADKADNLADCDDIRRGQPYLIKPLERGGIDHRGLAGELTGELRHLRKTVIAFARRVGPGEGLPRSVVVAQSLDVVDLRHR